MSYSNEDFLALKEQIDALKAVGNQNTVTVTNDIRYLKEQLELINRDVLKTTKLVAETQNLPDFNDLINKLNQVTVMSSKTDNALVELRKNMENLKGSINSQNKRVSEIEYLKIPSIIPKRTPVNQRTKTTGKQKILITPTARKIIPRIVVKAIKRKTITRRK